MCSLCEVCMFYHGLISSMYRVTLSFYVRVTPAYGLYETVHSARAHILSSLFLPAARLIYLSMFPVHQAHSPQNCHKVAFFQDVNLAPSQVILYIAKSLARQANFKCQAYVGRDT